MKKTRPNATSVDETKSVNSFANDPAPRSWAWLTSGVGMVIETLALVGMAVMVFAGLINGSASTTSRALTEGLCLVLLAIGTALLAYNLFRRAALAKTPTLLWNGMLFAVGINLVQGGGGVAGWATLAVSAITFAAALVLPRYELDDDPKGE